MKKKGKWVVEMMTLIIIFVGLFLILKFWRSILMFGIIVAVGLFLISMMGILNVWAGIDVDTVLKAVQIIVGVLVIGSIFIGNIFSKIMAAVTSILK